MVKYRCGTCNKLGHNARTCDGPSKKRSTKIKASRAPRRSTKLVSGVVVRGIPKQWWDFHYVGITKAGRESNKVWGIKIEVRNQKFRVVTRSGKTWGIKREHPRAWKTAESSSKEYHRLVSSKLNSGYRPI